MKFDTLLFAIVAIMAAKVFAEEELVIKLNNTTKRQSYHANVFSEMYITIRESARWRERYLPGWNEVPTEGMPKRE
jgi:hypothetical protein